MNHLDFRSLPLYVHHWATQLMFDATRNFSRDTSGSVVIIAALGMPMLVGGLGLGAEVGYWYMEQRKLQHGADLAAYAAASRLAQEADQQTLEEVALHVAAQSGFTDAIGDLEVHHPPLSGPNAGDEEMVEVVLTEQHPRFFSAIFGTDQVQMQGRAVAKIEVPKICMLALSKTASNALHAQGSTRVELVNCSIGSNSTSSSSLRTEGQPTVIADCAYGSGGYQKNGSGSIRTTVCAQVETNHAPFRDPYSSVTFPAPTAPCEAGSISGTTVTTNRTLSNGVGYKRFCSLSVSGNVTFSPGLYIVDGNMTGTGGSVRGSGVTFAVSGSVSLEGTISLNVSAPTSGPYSGLLFFGDRDTTIETAIIRGNSSSSYGGAVYFPTGNLTFTGSSATANGCTQVIANTILLTGQSQLRAACNASGTSTIAAPGGSRSLVE